MFSNNFRYNTTETGRYVKELPLSFPKLKRESKNSFYWIFIAVFVLLFLFRPMVVKLRILFGKIAISQPVLKTVS